MTPEGDRLSRAVRNAAAMQTIVGHLRVVTRMVNELQIEVTTELAEAREGVIRAEQRERAEVVSRG